MWYKERLEMYLHSQACLLAFLPFARKRTSEGRYWSKKNGKHTEQIRTQMAASNQAQPNVDKPDPSQSNIYKSEKYMLVLHAIVIFPMLLYSSKQTNSHQCNFTSFHRLCTPRRQAFYLTLCTALWQQQYLNIIGCLLCILWKSWGPTRFNRLSKVS